VGRRAADIVDAGVSDVQALNSSWRGGEVAGRGGAMCGAAHRCRRLSEMRREAVGTPLLASEHQVTAVRRASVRFSPPRLR